MSDLISVKVRFFAWIREEVGRGEIVIKCKDTLYDVFECIRMIIGDKINKIIYDGRLREGIIIAVNNEVVTENLDRIILRDKTVVDIMPLGSGG